MDDNSLTTQSPAFDAAGLHEALDAMAPDEIDDLPFGVVRLDEQLAVSLYNQEESRLSGLTPARVLGKPFFTAVAPCLDNALVGGRYRSEAALDETREYVLAFRMKPIKARLRLLKRADRAWSYFCATPL